MAALKNQQTTPPTFAEPPLPFYSLSQKVYAQMNNVIEMLKQEYQERINKEAMEVSQITAAMCACEHMLIEVYGKEKFSAMKSDGCVLSQTPKQDISPKLPAFSIDFRVGPGRNRMQIWLCNLQWSFTYKEYQSGEQTNFEFEMPALDAPVEELQIRLTDVVRKVGRYV